MQQWTMYWDKLWSRMAMLELQYVRTIERHWRMPLPIWINMVFLEMINM